MTKYVASFDIAVLPDVTPYSSPLKLFEYLQLGSAIVAPDMENIREILTDGHDALLFAPDAADSLEAALLKLCADDALRGPPGRGRQGHDHPQIADMGGQRRTRGRGGASILQHERAAGSGKRHKPCAA